jgi:hypothetical protein
MPGIAFGRSSKKQSLCDVLIGEEIWDYEPERVGRVSIPRGSQTRATPILLNRAVNLRDWKFQLKSGKVATYHRGLLLSGEKLVDDKTFKATLFRKFPDAIGGEMESSGIAAACESKRVEWLVAKAICDWGEGKSDKFQEEAAAASADFFYSMFSSEHAFEMLHMLAADKAVELVAPAELRFHSEDEVKAAFSAIKGFTNGLRELQGAPNVSNRIANFIAEIAINAFQHGKANACKMSRINDGFLVEDDGDRFSIAIGDPLASHKKGGGTYSYEVLRSQHADSLRIMYDRRGATNTTRILFLETQAISLLSAAASATSASRVLNST